MGTFSTQQLYNRLISSCGAGLFWLDSEPILKNQDFEFWLRVGSWFSWRSDPVLFEGGIRVLSRVGSGFFLGWDPVLLEVRIRRAFLFSCCFWFWSRIYLRVGSRFYFRIGSSYNWGSDPVFLVSQIRIHNSANQLFTYITSSLCNGWWNSAGVYIFQCKSKPFHSIFIFILQIPPPPCTVRTAWHEKQIYIHFPLTYRFTFY